MRQSTALVMPYADLFLLLRYTSVDGENVRHVHVVFSFVTDRKKSDLAAARAMNYLVLELGCRKNILRMSSLL